MEPQTKDSIQKTCPKCDETKPLDAFPPRKSGRDGRRNECRTCHGARLRRWHAENPGKYTEYSSRCRERNPERDAANKLRTRCTAYGITPERYWEMLEEQDGHCAMCPKTPEENGRMLAVDHDHACCPDKLRSCGRCVRALLCGPCNVAIGFFESERWTALADDYLSRFYVKETA